MIKHFHRELEQLTRNVLVMGGLAENAVARAIRAFLHTDAVAAATVVDGDAEINAMELRIEEEVLKLLSLYAPTARDLRYVVGMFKITNDLERVGDLATNIAERAVNRPPDLDPAGVMMLDGMADRVREMVQTSLDAFVQGDRAAAEVVLRADDEIDEFLKRAYECQKAFVRDQGEAFPGALCLLSVAKNLERIADHATNIAEDVIYMVSGDVVKHHH